MSLPPSSLSDSHLPKNEETLSKLRSEKDLLMIFYGKQMDGLSPSALLALDERWEEVQNTISVIKHSIDRGDKGIVEMETSSLKVAEYIDDNNRAAVERIHGDLQNFRQGRFTAESEVLTNALRCSTRSNNDTQEIKDLITAHREYQQCRQDLADSLTPTILYHWPTGEVPQAMKDDMDNILHLEVELRKRFDIWERKQNSIISTPSPPGGSILGSELETGCVTCGSEHESAIGSTPSLAICV